MMPLINYLESGIKKFSMQFGLRNIELKVEGIFSQWFLNWYKKYETIENTKNEIVMVIKPSYLYWRAWMLLCVVRECNFSCEGESSCEK